MALSSSASLFGGYSWLFALAFLLMLALLFGVFVYRQIGRLRRNNLRRGESAAIDVVGTELPPVKVHQKWARVNDSLHNYIKKNVRQHVHRRIDAVRTFRLCRQPNFTDCAIFAAHAQNPDRFRMIALDELGRDLDRQLEQLDPLLRRETGEPTWDYLLRVRHKAPLPALTERLIARLAFMHEWARYRTNQPFGQSELDELRSLLRRFLQVLSQNPQLTKLAPPQPYSTPSSSPKRRVDQSDGMNVRRAAALASSGERERRPLLREH